MSGAFAQGMPLPGAPIADEHGRISQEWWRFFLTLYNRTGSAAGQVTPSPQELAAVLFGLGAGVPPPEAQLPQLQPVVPAQQEWLPPLPDTVQEAFFPGLVLPAAVGLAPAVATITPGASPYTYPAIADGFVLISGGTVTGVTWSRDGTTFLATGVLAGFIPVILGDQVKVTYTVVPTMTFIPGRPL